MADAQQPQRLESARNGRRRARKNAVACDANSCERFSLAGCWGIALPAFCVAQIPRLTGRRSIKTGAASVASPDDPDRLRPMSNRAPYKIPPIRIRLSQQFQSRGEQPYGGAENGAGANYAPLRATNSWALGASRPWVPYASIFPSAIAERVLPEQQGVPESLRR